MSYFSRLGYRMGLISRYSRQGQTSYLFPFSYCIDQSAELQSSAGFRRATGWSCTDCIDSALYNSRRCYKAPGVIQGKICPALLGNLEARQVTPFSDAYGPCKGLQIIKKQCVEHYGVAIYQICRLQPVLELPFGTSAIAVESFDIFEQSTKEVCKIYYREKRLERQRPEGTGVWPRVTVRGIERKELIGFSDRIQV